MARTTTKATGARARKSKKSPLGGLPEFLQAFAARRLLDITAGIFFLFGIFTLIALISYNPADPSWNTASDLSAANWGNRPGAWLADLLMQSFGIAGFALGAITATWGLRLFRRQTIRPFWTRVTATLLCIIFASIAMAQIPAGEWNAHPYLGGSAGTLLLERIVDIIAWPGRSAMAWISGIIALTTFLFGAAIKREELAFAANQIKTLSVIAVLGVYVACSRFYGWIRHYNDPNYMPPPMPAFPKLTMFQPDPNAPAPVKTAPKKQAKISKPEPAADLPPAPQPQVHTGAIPVVAPQKAANAGEVNQQRFNLADVGDWELPPLSILSDVPDDYAQDTLSEDALRKNAELLQNVLADFNIEGEIVSIHPGPVVTLYELEPAPGTKTSRVISLADDIARSMSAISVRCAVVPGRNVIGIELPNDTRQIVYMKELLASRLFEKTKAALPLILGKDIGGQPILADLAKMPHLLVAGTTGSGKSVAVNTMILSLLFRLPPEKCRFIMIDPKMLELSVYDDIPHLLSPVVTEPGKAVVALKWTVQEMEERYRAMSKLGVRNIEGYNQRLREAQKKGESLMRKVQTGFDSETGKPVFEEQPMDTTELPYIVVVVDEFADLMLVAGKDVENAIQRLAQMARAAGIHLIMATQRPSVDVITGVIKANFPTRISFSVTSKIDSRTILGEGGAEQFLGMGDMLYMAPGGRITRVHGPFVSDNEVQEATDFLRSQSEPSYIEDVTEGSGDFGDSAVMGALFGEEESSNAVDELYDKAVAVVAREGKASTSFIQRHLQIGYNRAARIVEEMERQGIISAASPTGKREILVRDFSDV